MKKWKAIPERSCLGVEGVPESGAQGKRADWVKSELKRLETLSP